MVQGEIAATDSIGDDARPDFASTRGPRALDVVVRWGDWVLAVHELSPPRPFFVGEQNADVILPREQIGARRLPLVLTRWDGEVRLVVPQDARILIGRQSKRMKAARLIARGLARPSSALEHAAEVTIIPGQTATLFLGQIAIDFGFSDAAPHIERQAIFEKRILGAQFFSLALHALLLGILFYFVGPAEVVLEYGMTPEQLNEFQRRLWRLERLENRLQWELDGYESRAKDAVLHSGPREPEARQKWMDSLGPAGDRWAQEIEAQAQRNDAPENDDRSLIGVFYDWPPPPPPPKQKLTIADVMKMPQVALPEEQKARNGRRFRGPRVRMGAVSVSGRLPPEVIHRIVRQNFGRFRLCYENGLRRNPNLEGRVAVRFVIGRDGVVSNVGNGGSDLPDLGMVRCVMRQFDNLEFPDPERGIVTVVFPILFSPPNSD